MAQKSAVAIDDMTRADFQLRRPGCDKAVMHEDGAVQSAVFRVAPGSGAPNHLHSEVYDIFVGIKGC